MLIPHRNLLIVAGLWLACALTTIWLPTALPVWQYGGALVLVFVLSVLARLVQRSTTGLERRRAVATASEKGPCGIGNTPTGDRGPLVPQGKPRFDIAHVGRVSLYVNRVSL